MIDLLDPPPAWHDVAACATPGQNPAAFYPAKGITAKAARQVCADCPAFAACLEWSLAHREVYGVWGGTAHRQRRRLGLVWVQRAHDYRADCVDEGCRWCRTVDALRAACTAPQGRQWLNGPGAQCGHRSTYARGCRCGPCSLAISPLGVRLRDAGFAIGSWWARWFGTNTEQRLVARARRLAEFELDDIEDEAA